LRYQISWTNNRLYYRKAGDRYWQTRENSIRMDHPLRRRIICKILQEKGILKDLKSWHRLIIDIDEKDLLFLKKFMDLSLRSKYMRKLFEEFLENGDWNKLEIRSAVIAQMIKR